MLIDLMTRALEAVRAEHAVNNGIHASKGCHGCVLWSEFRKYVLENEEAYPERELLVSASMGGKARFAIWVSEPLTHAKWDLLRRHLELLEPEHDAQLSAEAEPRAAPPESPDSLAAPKEEGRDAAPLMPEEPSK